MNIPPFSLRLSALVILFLASACQAFPVDRLLPSGTVLYQDDFATQEGGWNQSDSDQATSGYTQDTYHIFIKQAGVRAWAVPGLAFSDVRIEVEAAKTSGSDDNLFGVLCRYVDAENYYALAASSDGYFGIFKNKQGDFKLLDGEAMLPSDAIRQGLSTNHLTAECIGATLVLYINGLLLDTQIDADFLTGDAGLIAAAGNTPDVEIVFDNFSVIKP